MAKSGGFHPKAVFWRDKNKCYALIGSANLTSAAFESNIEANVYAQISSNEFAQARQWIEKLEANAEPITANLLVNYQEAQQSKGRLKSPKKSGRYRSNYPIIKKDESIFLSVKKRKRHLRELNLN